MPKPTQMVFPPDVYNKMKAEMGEEEFKSYLEKLKAQFGVDEILVEELPQEVVDAMKDLSGDQLH